MKKRERAKGGSARRDFVEQNKSCCFKLLSFVRIDSLTPKFDELKPLASEEMQSSYRSTLDSSFHSIKQSSPSGANKRKIFEHSTSSSIITYGSKKKDTYYALKSIHLDRCTTPTFVRELKNEGTHVIEDKRSATSPLTGFAMPFISPT